MSAETRRLIMAHTIMAVTAMVLCTLLAALHDIPGTDAMFVIMAAAGIGGSGAASAASVDSAARRAVTGVLTGRGRAPGE